jgi:hypothetical protein
VRLEGSAANASSAAVAAPRFEMRRYATLLTMRRINLNPSRQIGKSAEQSHSGNMQ